MRVKEQIIILKIFIAISIPFIAVIIAQLCTNTSYTEISKLSFENEHNPLRLHIIGDFGELHPNTTYNSTLPVKLVAHLMDHRAKVYPISFIISLGDNFYPNLSSVFDPMAHTIMNEIFDLESIKIKPWYLILGNHDYQVDPYDQIEMNKLYAMWNLPDYYYNKTLKIDNGFFVSFIFLDGVVLEGSASERKTKHYEWLEKILEDQAQDPTIKWKFVVNHMAFFSSSTGHADSEPLKQELFPLLYKYKIDIYFAGHSHVMSHFVTEYSSVEPNYTALGKGNYDCSFSTYTPYGTSTNYNKGFAMHEVVQGCGGGDLNLMCTNKTTSMANLIFNSATYGYSELYISSQMVQVSYFNIFNSEPIYSFEIWGN
ncbi:hypothetical protein SteCoe_22408 [Stentor coeruleus]|uniref:Calcineurin-like phosphoesterase domain-containing protein n=1 Tax=Stentor coeruleus TaxID=5963 RepID=A0A1R2BME4_9CILI|nr:hypothetical protein SteCoe_22408 [Stentor coeruleus]